MGIAEAYRSQGISEKAIAYYQRIYNMYRAYPDLVATAYLASSELFESQHRIVEAVSTIQEMLKQEHLTNYPEWEAAKQKLVALLPHMPEQPETTETTKAHE